VSGATVRLKMTGQSDIVASPVTFNSPTSLTAGVNLSVAAPGSWDVVVTNPDQGSGTCVACFTVAGALPTVTAATPNKLGQGASSVDVVLTGTHFANGATVTVSGLGVTVGTVTVTSPTSLTVVLSVSSSAATTARDVTVTNTDSQAGVCTGCLTIQTGPTVTLVSPTSRGQGAADQPFSITGTGFVDGATVSFSGTGITVGTVTVGTSTSISTTITVSSLAATGARDVIVTNPDHGRYTCAGCFTVNAGPTVTSLSPNAVGQGVTDQDVTVTGTGFVNGATVAFSGTGITVNLVTFGSATSLTVNIDVASDATPGARNVTVTNPDAGTSQCAACFTVTVSPSITSASPDHLGQGATSQTVALVGSGFQTGATITVSGTGVTPGTATVVDSTHLNVPLTVGSTAATGARTLTVHNTDGGTGSCSDCFSITPRPAATGLNPAALGQGSSNVVVTLTGGSGFASGMTVSVEGTGVTVGTVTVTNATTATVVLSVSASATTGPRDVTLTNTDHGTSTCTDCLTINDGPTVTSVSPPAASNNGSANLTVTGTHFVDGASVILRKAGQSDIVASPVTFTDSTTLHATFNLTLASPGAWDAVVSNPDHGTGSCSGCFTVAAATPTATAITPDHLGRGATNVAVDITGTNFANGATVTISGSGVTVGTVTVNSSTDLTALISVSGSAATGARTVTVTNADGQSGICSCSLTINTGPAITSINPTSRGQGATNQSFTITGTGFVDGATVTFSGTGITVGTVTVNSATSISTTITVAEDAATTARDVTVTNPDHGVGTCAACFTVHAAPTVVSASPDTAGQGAVARSIVLTGTGFQSGATVSFSGTGITVDSVTFNSATSLTVTIDVASDAALTSRDILVTNPDGGPATCSACFTINIHPTTTSLTPSSRGQGATDESIDVTGTDFVDGATVSFAGTGITVDSVTFVDSTTLTIIVDVASIAATGTRNVTVTNPDGGMGTCSACFTVNSGPAVTSITPAQRGRGLSNQDLAFAGTGFTGATTVQFSGIGITVNSATFGTATTGTVNVSVASDAPLGLRNVILENTDGGTLTCTGCFTVTGPTSVSFTPPTTTTGSDVATFSQPVSGISSSNVFLRLTGTVTTVASSLTCANEIGAPVSCSTGSVKTVTIKPSVALLPGQYYTVYVAPNGSPAIIDYGGLTVAPATGPFRASTVEQETSTAAAYYWRGVSTSSAFGGSYAVDHLANSQLTFKFTGTGITWYTNTGRNYGLAYVYIDGVLRGSFGQYASSTHYRVARSFGGLTLGSHTITIRVRGLKGAAGGTGTDIAVDAFQVGATRFDTPSVTYSWRRAGSSFASGGAYALSDGKGSAATFTFRGTGFDWYTVLGPSMGKANVYVDGVLIIQFDNYASSTQYNVRRTFRKLSDAIHTVTIKLTGTRRSASSGTVVAVDRWVVI